MKISPLSNILAGLAMAGLTASLAAQDAVTATAPTPTQVSAATPNLSPAALQVLQLAQAKVGDGTILAFVKGSPASYHLDAPAIIYLRQQGISDAVLTAMLTPPPSLAVTNLPQPALAPVPQPTTPAPVPETADVATSQAPDTTVVDPPQASFIETPPDDPPVVYQPVYTPYYYPPVIYSVGIYGAYHGGGNSGYHGGGNGGYHGGGSGGGHGGNTGGGNNGGHGGWVGPGGAPHR